MEVIFSELPNLHLRTAQATTSSLDFRWPCSIKRILLFVISPAGNGAKHTHTGDALPVEFLQRIIWNCKLPNKDWEFSRSMQHD